MTAKDAISPQIVPLRSATTYREGLEEMRNAGRHILPVVDDGVYIGLVSDSAPLYAMESVGDAVTVMKPELRPPQCRCCCGEWSMSRLRYSLLSTTLPAIT